MRALNTMLATILAAGLVLGGALVVLMATSALAPGDLALSGWFRTQFRDLQNLTSGGTITAIAVGAIAAAAGMLTLALEFAAAWGPDRRLHMTDAMGHRITITSETVQQLVQDACGNLKSIRSVRCSARPDRNGLVIDCEASLEHSANIVEAGTELEERIRAEVGRRTGLTVADIRLQLNLAPPAKPGRGLSGPLFGGDREKEQGATGAS